MALFRNVVALESQAQAAYKAGLYEEASVLHSRAALIAQQLAQPQLVAVLCFRLGAALRANQAMLDAVAAYEAGFQVLCTATMPSIEQMLASFQSVGPYVYRFDRMSMPDHEDAAVAAELESAMIAPTLAASLLIECAQVYEAHSSMYLALYSYRRILEQLEMPQMLDLRATILARLGVIAHQLGELGTVEEALNELVALRSRATDLQLLCHILPALGLLYQTIGSVENAISVYQAALNLSHKIGDPVAIGQWRGRLARLALQQRTSKRNPAPVHEQAGIEAEAYMDFAQTPEFLESNMFYKQAMLETVYVDRVKH